GTAVDRVIGVYDRFIAAHATNREGQNTSRPSGLINYTDYFFGVTAYAYNEESVPKVLESAATKITLRPANVVAGSGGSVQQAELGDQLPSIQGAGIGRGIVSAQVVDPTEITGATYTVEIITFEDEGTGEELAT